ncbi:MAG: right-handed parallel beta-helix repeat-containing protein [Fibrobacteres bacterium]|nr:right-handed parallel beta-helix repeat-containing protein [Fibrobacterota bacterium]
MPFRSVIRPILAALACAAVSARAGATYYFAANGNDASDCQSLSAPCRTLDRLNALPQLPGASFLLRRGDRFPGSILAQGSGSLRDPMSFSAYGDGLPPIIDGGLPVSNWTLVSQGPTAWVYATDIPPETDGQPFALIKDNRVVPLARFPASGFIKIAGADSESLVLDPLALAGHPHAFAGTNLRVRALRRILSNRTVRGFDSATGRLTWDEALPKDPAPNAGAFFTDTPEGLDQPGSWYCYPEESPLPRDGHRLRLALAPDDAPAAHSLRIANAGYGIKGSGIANVRIAGIDFESQVSAALYFYDCVHVEIDSCGIRNAILTGIDFRGSGFAATGNLIEGALLAGISAQPDPDLNPLQTAETGARILGNRIARIGLFANLGRSGPDDDGEMGIGIRALGDGDHIGDNRIDSTACDGIRFLGKRDMVEGNSLRMTCLHLDEAGAIHAGPAQGPWGTEGSEVRGNLILSAPGSAAGTAGASTQAYGLFLDENASGIIAEGNFIAEADLGICIRRGRGHAIVGNVLYANRLAPLRDGRGPIPAGGTVGIAGATGAPLNHFQDNVLWNVWNGKSGFLPPASVAEARCVPDSAHPCPPTASAGNLACVEAGTSAICNGDATARYPGAPTSLLANRFREFAKAMAGDPDQKTRQAALQAILPIAKGK